MNNFYTQQYIILFLKIRTICKKWDISEVRINVWIQFEKAVSTAFIVLPLLLLSLTEPVLMSPPSVSSLSPYSLNVSWEKPADNMTRGEVVGYDISMVSEQSPPQFIPVVFSQVLLFSTNILSELTYVFILIFFEFTGFSDRILPYAFLKWGIYFLK